VNRRLFVQCGLCSLLLPAATLAMPGGKPGAWTQFFYDNRFAGARDLATRLAGPTALTAVGGDVTGLWTSELAQALLAAPIRMGGVTTESFCFCLRVLMSDHVRIDARVDRIGPDLHLWTLHSGHSSSHGTTTWQNRSRPA
jgi:hypothetical protein